MKVIAIIPSFNEEKTLGGVLSVLVNVPAIDEIVVVNDGSSDHTAEVAGEYPVTLVNLEVNRGKGGAIKAGLDRSQADVFLFLDADLVGLRPAHVEQLLDPVVSGKVAMSVGLFEKGRIATDLAQKVAPHLSGQRAVRRELLEKVDGLDISRFGVEVAIKRIVERHHFPVAEVYLPYLTHVTKEEKLGFIKGFAARMKMYWEIVRYYAKIAYTK